MIDVYLACAYTHPDSSVMQQRVEQISSAAAGLIKKGFVVYSPISHSHQMVVSGNLPVTWDFWKVTDTTFLRLCRNLVIHTEIDGWEASKGVTAEILFAKAVRIPVWYGVDSYLKVHYETH